MLIFALDSTAVVGSVALCRDEKPLASFTIKNGNTHSETLLPMVEAVLKSAGVTVADIDLFACSVGPGSFTGVRIGAATIKGLAFDKSKPCIGVSTLESLAYNGAIPADGKVILCPAMNARRAQVYNALFACENGIAHGPHIEFCYLKALLAKGNTNNSYAPNNSRKEPKSCADASKREEPQNVSDKFHLT